MVTSQAHPAFRIHLFGQPRFALGDAPFKFSAPPKTLPLLAYLLLHGRPVARETLAFSFWPDENEDEALANLRRHINHLKKALPAGGDAPWLISTDNALGWNADSGVWFDVAEFVRLSDSEQGRPEAVNLYAGDLLENLYDDWILSWRERLRAKYFETLHALVLEQRSRRNFAGAAKYLHSILAIDPWREDAVRQLMAVNYERGDRAGALRIYAEFARRLSDEMGVEPMPETMATRDGILRNAPLGAARERQAAGERAQSLNTAGPALPFVGREHEMEQLRAVWTRTARNFGATVFIGGEAGIGKTRLTEELRLIAESEGARVIVGTTSSPEAYPYQAFAEALRSAHALVMSLDLPPAHLASLARIVPTFGAGNPESTGPLVLDPERDQSRLLGALERCLTGLARTRPVLLVLEDLHWAGAATIAALEFVAQRITTAPLFLVATYRSDELKPAHALLSVRRGLLEQHRATALGVGRLSSGAVSDLVRQVPDLSVRADDDIASTLYAESEGNPLLLLHIVRTIVESPIGLGVRSRTAGPAEIRATLAERIERLPAAARTLAEIAAVGGRSFDVDVVRGVSGWEEADLFDALGVLLDRHFVKELSSGQRFSYGFTHHLVQATLYDGVPAEARVHRHRRFGRVMEDSHADPSRALAGDIARHYDLGGDGAKAARWYLAAGRQAASVHALDDAMRYLTRGVDIANDRRLRADLLLQRESVQSRHGDREGQRADLEALAQLAAAASDEDLACEVLFRKSRLANVLGQREEESRFVDDLRARAQVTGSQRHAAQAQYAAASLATLLDRYDEARTSALGALEAWKHLDCIPEQVECLCLLAHIALHRGAIADSEPFIQQARALAERAGRPELAAFVFWSAAGSALVRHQFSACIDLCRNAANLYRAVGDREGEADAAAREASALSRLERYEDALTANETAARIFETIGKRQGLATTQVNAGVISLRLGDLDKACELLESAGSYFSAMLDVRGEVVCELNIAFAHLVGGDATAAKNGAQHALSKTRAIGLLAMEAQALATLGAAERNLGEIDAAIDHMREGLALERALDRTSDIANDLADLTLAYLRKGDLAAAKLTTDELLHTAEMSAAGALWPHCLYWVAARAFHKARDSKRAAALLERTSIRYRAALDSIADAATRARFSKLSFNREIEAAVISGRWPKD